MSAGRSPLENAVDATVSLVESACLPTAESSVYAPGPGCSLALSRGCDDLGKEYLGASVSFRFGFFGL